MKTEPRQILRWQQRVETMAREFSRQMELAFRTQRQAAVETVPRAVMAKPTDINECDLFIVNIFMDYLATTSAGIACSTVAYSDMVEEAFVRQIRDKFALLRKMHDEGKI